MCAPCSPGPHSSPAHKLHSYRFQFLRQTARDWRPAWQFDKAQALIQIVRTPIADQYVQYDLPIGLDVYQVRAQYAGK